MRQKILYVNACFREGSRTADLVELMKERLFGEGEVTEISLGDLEFRPMDRQMLKVYNESVASHAFEDPMFTYARQFREADRVVIAAPFWNYDLPAVLHAYLELVCTQGITFDIDEKGVYGSLCKAKKLTFVTTAGGFIPEGDPASSYLKTLCSVFFEIPEFEYIKAEGLDIWGADVQEILEKAAGTKGE